jgi:uncharacterized protein (TIGR00251 family)
MRGILPEEAMKLVDKDGAVRFAVHAKPRARKSRVVGERGEAVEVALQAPPIDGAANEELVRFLARVLGVARRDVALVRGDASREKLVAVTGLPAAEVEARLRAAVVASKGQ